MKLIVCIVMIIANALILVAAIDSHAEITKTAVWHGAYGVETCYTANEKAIFQASSAIWGMPQKILSCPISIDMFESNGGIQHLFILDRNQRRFQYFGTQDKILTFFTNYSGGPQLQRPSGIVVQPDQTASDYHTLHVLDAGRNTIEAYLVNRVNNSIQYSGEIYGYGNDDGHGPLKQPSGLAYCYFELPSCSRLLAVADTYNHRILIMTTDGTVIHEIGGPGPGSGMNQFRYPTCVAAVGLNDINCEAVVYVGDKGNNRIVCLYLDENQDLHWYKTVDFPIDAGDNQDDFPREGIVDIAVDDWYKNGVWVLDSRRRGIIQFDQFLEQEIQTFTGMDYKGRDFKDLSMHASQLAFLGPYTRDTGFELFEVKASFFNIEAAPNPFDPDFEWLTLKFTSSAEAHLDAWVKDSTGTVVVHDTSLAKDNFVFPQVNYLVWDGRDDSNQRVAPGLYHIYLRLTDAAWQTAEARRISVRVKPASVKVLATHKAIADPKWSPDGSYIAFAVDDTLPYSGTIAKINTSTLSETVLTSEGLGNRHPSWSPGGDKIAFTKYTEYIPSFAYWESGVFLMEADGQNVQVISDTSEMWNRARDPSWIKGGKQISYIRYHKDASPPYRILAHNIETEANETVYLPDNIDDGIYRHLWSPREDRIAMAMSDGSQYHLFSYDTATGIRSQLTSDDEDGLDEEKSFSYSPDGLKLGFLENLVRLGNDSWKLLTIPSRGGTKIPISGMSSDVIEPGPGVSWSPDGTKIAFVLRYDAYDKLVLADYIRNSDTAFPAALITRPFAGSNINGIVGIVGSVKDNVSINGSTVLSELTNYSIEYGAGTDPFSWYTRGIELARDCLQGDCQITNDTLALWNTGSLESGLYTLRFTALGGTNSNVLYRCVDIRHCTIRVKKDGTGDFLTIQAAVDSAQAGDTILVYAGDYAERVVMKEAVHLIGVEDGVRIIGGNGISLKIENHNLPCSIRNINIRNDGYYSLGTGILISNSSPTITDCLIQNQGSDMSSQPCGIRITGNSKPTFFNCTIRDNKATYGAGLRINAGSEEFPAPSFYNCSFVGNESTGNGGAVYMNYTTPLDTTRAQPYFNGCVFRDNTATTNGSALYLGYCHAPFFTQCTFLNNRPETASGSPIYGISSGGQFVNCTFKGNAGESYTAVLDLYNGTDGKARVKVNNCIFAYNDIEAIRRGGSYFDVNYSCFYSNEPVDSAWLDFGTGNFQANPAFCDRQNNDLHLYSFSPCAPTVSGFDLIGAYGVDCTPQLDSLLHCNNPHSNLCPPHSCPGNPTLYVCPEGTWDKLVVHIDLADSDMTRDIAAEELELIPPFTPCVKFFCNESIHADSAATSGNGWKTTITYGMISGCGADSLHVTLDGNVIGTIRVAFKSLDYTGPGGFPDGVVNLADLTPFGSTYSKCKGQTGYNECFNFAQVPGDTCVNLPDFAFFGSHYQHRAPCYGTTARTTSKAISGAVLELPAQLEIIDKERYLNVDVILKNAQELVSVCLALDGEKVGLEFLGWEENEAQQGTIMAAPVTRDGSNIMFISFIAEEGIRADSVCLGTVRYRVKSEDASLTNNRVPFEEMSLLAFGDAMTSDGAIKGIGSAGIEIEGEVAKYFDYLKNCYPNPFNPITTVEYSISRDSHVNLSIYNANGQLVRVLVNGKQKKNVYSISWDGKDNGGRAVASGIYFCRLKSDFFEKSQKLILLR